MKKGKGKNHPSPSMNNALGNLQLCEDFQLVCEIV